MQDTEFKKANKDELRSLFGYLEFCLTQIVKDNELGALEQVCSNLKGLLVLACCAELHWIETHQARDTPCTPCTGILLNSCISEWVYASTTFSLNQ